MCATHVLVLLSAGPSWARSHVCDEGEFRCNRSRLCVPQNRNCDQRPDCPDGSDEWNCCKYIYSVAAASRRCVCLVPPQLTIISIPLRHQKSHHNSPQLLPTWAKQLLITHCTNTSLGDFAGLPKVTSSLVMCVQPSVRLSV